MDNRTHWENVYQTKAPDAVSWYRPHLETSLDLIRKAGAPSETAVIDVGGGESTLVDDLILLGYQDVSVFDISQTALDVTKKRIGTAGEKVHWIVGDIVNAKLPTDRYDVWHDRAVFHFLTTEEQRAAYVRQVARSVKQGGYVIVATFAPDGPEKCSGLEVTRYDAESLHGQFGPHFNLIESRKESHRTPFETTQAFVYCFCRMS